MSLKDVMQPLQSSLTSIVENQRIYCVLSLRIEFMRFINEQIGREGMNHTSAIYRDQKTSYKVQANQKIDINSSGDVNTRGLNVTNKANMAFEASGSASAKVNSTGQLVLQGTMVMIN